MTFLMIVFFSISSFIIPAASSNSSLFNRQSITYALSSKGSAGGWHSGNFSGGSKSKSFNSGSKSYRSGNFSNSTPSSKNRGYSSSDRGYTSSNRGGSNWSFPVWLPMFFGHSSYYYGGSLLGRIISFFVKAVIFLVILTIILKFFNHRRKF